MSEAIPVSAPELPAKHFRIRKEIVYGFFLVVFCTGFYHLYDWWTYLNWPPHDGKNTGFVKSLDCNLMKYNLTKKNIESISSIGGFTGHLDRKMLFENPNCLTGLFLHSEGTGTRMKYHIYDVPNKQQTAVIEVTHTVGEDYSLKSNF